MNEFLKFQKKVEKCNTFEKENFFFQFEVVEKQLCCLDCFLKNNSWQFR